MQLALITTFIITVVTSNLAFGAATVFFKDGSKEVGNSAWIEGNSIYLNKSNEIYEFSPDEVNMEETLKSNRIGKYADIAIPDSKTKDHQEKSPPRKKAQIRPPAKVSKSVAQVAEGTSTSDSPTGKRPFFGVPIPEDSTVCSAELRDELLARYGKYNNAAATGDFSEYQKHIIAYQAAATQKALAGLSKKELQKRKKVLQEMAVKNYRATECMVSINSATAVVAGRGKSMSQGKFVDAHGTIAFKKENQSWKVQTSVWNLSM